jgi:serine/threonine-protein kinase HipA
MTAGRQQGIQGVRFRILCLLQQRLQKPPQVEELIKAGTSMGGARPKAVIEDGNALWIAKFNRPKVSVGGRDVLLVKRFDREKAGKGYHRARMVSGLTLLRTEDTHQSRDKWSYILLVEELRRVSAEAKKDAIELFRRMCFNALISNTDDHPRNHAIIAKNQGWKLSPAYDLTPTPHVSEERKWPAAAALSPRR